MAKNKAHSKKNIQEIIVENTEIQEVRKKAVREALKPLLKALVLWIILVAIVRIPFGGIKFVTIFETITATSFKALTNLFGDFTTSQENIIIFNGFAMKIIIECTIIDFYSLIISICVFSKWKKSHKFINCVLICSILFIINNLRFFLMGIIGLKYPNLFEVIHDYFWNVFFAILTLGLWWWRDNASQINQNPKFSNFVEFQQVK